MVLGCKTQEEVVTNQDPVTTNTDTDTTEQNRFVGVVENATSCLVLKTEVKPGEYQLLWPINLEEQYQVEGMKLKFTYAINRAQIPEDCTADHAVKVYEVSRMR